jgi:tRNA modification GTPase
MDKNDTIVSIITPATGGSICLLRISGSEAIAVTNKFFSPANLENEKGGCFFYGTLQNAFNDVIDQVIVYLFKKPKSFTGEDVIEISCHSNIFIVQEILNLFISEGCRIAEPGEYSKRAFLNGKIDLAQAEAIADLIASKSKTGVKNALNIIKGSLSEKINDLKQSVIEIASLLELELDFSEEDLELIPKRKFIETVKKAINEVNGLLDSYSRGREFQKGIEVLITGRPNVGKSSLMNALLQKDRVIVSPVPGTTRDMIHEDIILNNTVIRLIDTAGIRISEDHIEKEGVDRAMELIKSARLILMIFDLSEDINTDDLNILDTIKKESLKKVVVTGNKYDKPVNLKTKEFITSLGAKTIFVSAKQNKNISELKDIIYNHISDTTFLNEEEIIISNARQYEILKRVYTLLEENLASFTSGQGHEYIAADLRMTIDALSELTGEITTDDILNNIFSNFCIGK